MKQFNVTLRPSKVDSSERQRRLKAAYNWLLEVAVSAKTGQGSSPGKARRGVDTAISGNGDDNGD